MMKYAIYLKTKTVYGNKEYSGYFTMEQTFNNIAYAVLTLHICNAKQYTKEELPAAINAIAKYPNVLSGHVVPVLKRYAK